MNREYTVSLCMIVKNEEKYLRRCLDSMKGIVDEIIIIDTGSTDNTLKIANDFNAKVGFFEWNQSFSDARNKSLELATKDWIIVLDADEYLRIEDRDELIKAFNDYSHDGYIIKTLNFNGTNNQSYITNLNQRIFKNNKNFKYQGAIHEQVVSLDNTTARSGFKIIDVGFYHTGYLSEVVKEKNKVERNLGILEKVAEEEPENMFTLFNLANEYSQKGDNEKALRLYNKAYESRNFGVGFMPKLVMFRLISLINMGYLDEALIAIKEGLAAYPDYTELVYYRGTIERNKGYIIKAIQSFETCLKMGKPRMEIEFQKMCYDYGPLINLAEIFQEQGEFENSIKLYNQCLALDTTRFQLVYPIFDCLVGLKLENRSIVEMMKKYFNLTNVNNQVVFCNLLIEKGFYHEAGEILNTCPALHTQPQLIFLHGKVELYLGNYGKSKDIFIEYSKAVDLKTVELYLFILNLLEPIEETINWDSVYFGLSAYLTDGSWMLVAKDNATVSKMIAIMKELKLMGEMDYFRKLADLTLESNVDTFRHQYAVFFEKIGELDLAQSLIIKSVQGEGRCNRENVELLLKTFKER